jgi:CRP/FNR family transcriptional regulator, cyclic AMP receptor protein
MHELQAIQDVPLFSHMSTSQLETLARASTRCPYAPGEAVFSQGDVPEFLYIVDSGTVDVVLPANPEEIILASFAPGSFFGELAVFDYQPRTATARATSVTSLIRVPLRVVEGIIDEHPAAARQFIGVVIQRLRGADELLSRLQIRNVNDIMDARMTVGERVADMVARFGGSWTFIICFGILLAAWMGVNTYILVVQPPDPYPYIFLNLILSCIAALQAPIIMMSQNRQAAKDRLQVDQDFQINIKAEFAIQQLHRKIDDLRASLMQHRRAEADLRRKSETQ